MIESVETTHKRSDRAGTAELGPVAAARPGSGPRTPARDRAGTQAPAVAHTAAAGVRWCEFCQGSGRMLAFPVGAAGYVLPEEGVLVWCRCARGRRAELALRQLRAWLAETNTSPTIRELAGSCGLTLSAAYRAVCDLADAGLVRKPTPTTSRTLRIIPGGQR